MLYTYNLTKYILYFFFEQNIFHILIEVLHRNRIKRVISCAVNIFWMTKFNPLKINIHKITFKPFLKLLT